MAIKKNTKPVKSTRTSDSDEKKRVSRWFARLSDSSKAYTRWFEEFKVAKNKRYWRGQQRTGDDRIDSKHQERVQVNLIAPTIAIKIPSLYFYFPYARVLGIPRVSSTEGTTLDERAQLLQDTGNSIIRDPETGFRRETLMALKESMWAFGLIEIGYSAEFVDNPYYQKPPLTENEKVEEEEGRQKDDAPATPPAPVGAKPTQPRGMPEDDLANLKQMVDKEQFYVRHIPPEQFRVSVSGQPFLEANDWCAYYEWMYTEDVKASPAYNKDATDKLESGGSLTEEYSGGGDMTTTSSTAVTFSQDAAEERDRDRGGQVKVWKIWDIRQKKRYVVAEGCSKFLIDGKPYKTLPLFPLSFEDQDDDFYPIPPITAMLGPQDEYNDSREMLRGLRKTIYPRYLASPDIEDDELRKLEDGGSGVIAKANSLMPTLPVQPVNQPTLDSAIVRTLSISKDDLLQVSGVSGEARGQAEADTATQASIINQRSLVRDSFGRLRVAEWLGQITRGLIQMAIDNMSLPMWVLRNCDPQSQFFLADAMSVSTLYREITLTDLKEADQLLRWDVSVDVETLSPLTEDTMRSQIQNVVTLLAQPPVAMLLSKSPPLLKICLDRFGIRASKDQEAIRMALGMVASMPPDQQQGVPSQPAGPGGGGMPLAPQPSGPGSPSQQTQMTPNGPMTTPSVSQPGGPPATLPPGGGTGGFM